MAKKDITSGFDNSDAQDFLKGYREDAMPTYRKAKKDSATESPPSQEIKEELARIPVNPERTKEEEEYLRTFVETCPVDAFNKQGRQALFNEDLSIAQYVHNVLAQHFKDVEPILNSLYQKSKQF